jgi:AraC-like DNA-binding protein
MSGIPVERYSTADAPATGRLAYWNELACQTFNNLSVDADDPGGFRGDMVRAPLGELSLMSASSTAATVTRINDHSRIARGPRCFDLHFQLSGRSLNRQAGREALLEAGDFTLCDATQPYSVLFREANHMLCIKAPMAPLAERLGDLDRLVCVPVSGQSGPGAVLSSFLRSLWSQIEGASGDNDWTEAASSVALDLIALAYRPSRDGRGSSSGQYQWMQRARSVIEERLCDPDLGVAGIAEALGVSPRYLQMLFAQAGATPSAYIMDRRLRLAAERLRREDAGCVTEVAMAVGFNDLTHFGRAFRRRFGVTPRDYRDGMRAPRWQAPPLAGALPEASPHTA